jgi:thioesterase domain-containing protein
MTALSFVDLARHLGPDQPFYAFQPFGLDQDHEPHHSVEAMATAYLQELRLLQPEGPYLLGGRCFGSSVAFEIAQRLIANGEEVALLALQDGDPPDGDLAVPGTAGHYLHRFVRHWQQGRLREALERYRRRKVRDGRLAIKRHVTYMIGNREARRIQRVHDAHLIAKTRYVGQTYPGTITLFWSSEWFAYLGELWHARWDRLAGAGVENHVVPGLHWTMLEAPSVEELAAQLRTCLDAVHQDERSST